MSRSCRSASTRTGVITDAKFKAYGCGSAVARSSLVTGWVEGMTVQKAMTI
jgi:nitrogen fixation NifU-like protein